MHDRFAHRLAKEYALRSALYGKRNADKWLTRMCKRSNIYLGQVVKHIHEMYIKGKSACDESVQ